MKYIYIYIFSFFILGCSSPTRRETTTHTAKIKKIATNVYFNNIVESYECVKLETSPKCLLGEITDVLFEKERIYVVSDGIYCFNSTGKFLFAIDKKGRGPSEFIRIDGISISDGRIYLYDNLSNQLSLFDSKNGKFVEAHKVPYNVLSIYSAGDSYILDRGMFPSTLANNDERFLVCPKKNFNDIEYAYLPDKKNKIMINHQTTRNKEGILFTDFYDCRTYKITSDKIENYFCLDIKEDERLSDKQIRMLVDNGQMISNDPSIKSKKMGLQNVRENNSFIYGRFLHNEKFAYIIYDKTTRKHIAFEQVECNDFQNAPCEMIGAKDDYFCMITPSLNGETVKKYISQNKQLPKDHPEYKMQYILEKGTIEDNPILVFYKFKHIK